MNLVSKLNVLICSPASWDNPWTETCLFWLICREISLKLKGVQPLQSKELIRRITFGLKFAIVLRMSWPLAKERFATVACGNSSLLSYNAEMHFFENPQVYRRSLSKQASVSIRSMHHPINQAELCALPFRRR